MSKQDAILHIRIPSTMKQRITNIAKKRTDQMSDAVLVRQWLAEKLEEEEKKLEVAPQDAMR